SLGSPVFRRPPRSLWSPQVRRFFVGSRSPPAGCSPRSFSERRRRCATFASRQPPRSNRIGFRVEISPVRQRNSGRQARLPRPILKRAWLSPFPPWPEGRRLGGLATQYLLGKLAVGSRAFAVWIVFEDRLVVAGCLCESDVNRNDRREDSPAELVFHLRLYFPRDERPRVVHREDDPQYLEVGIDVLSHPLYGVLELDHAVHRKV